MRSNSCGCQSEVAAIVRAEEAERDCADLREEITLQQSCHALAMARVKARAKQDVEEERAAKEAAEARVHELEQQLRSCQRQLSALDLVGIAAPIQYALENDKRVSMNISFSTNPMKPRRNNDYEKEEDES